MKICTRCGIELEDEMSACPLCGTPAPAGPEQEAARPVHEAGEGHKYGHRRAGRHHHRPPSAGRILDLFRRVFHV